jgi:hypothetical protein
MQRLGPEQRAVPACSLPLFTFAVHSRGCKPLYPFGAGLSVSSTRLDSGGGMRFDV